MTKQIHVLADETLGGTLREYVEVERGAEVGEVVVMLADKYFTLISQNDELGIGIYRDDSGDELTTVFHPDFMKVLEPTDIVHIESNDGMSERYRLVDRKAEVGERVLIIDNNSAGFTEGFIGEVSESNEENVVINGAYGHYHGDYRIPEPVENASSPESTDDIIANLVARVAQTERDMLELIELVQRDRQVKQTRIDGVKDDIETWAQEVESVKGRQREFLRKAEYLNDKIEMCIDDIVALDERTKPTKITLTVDDLARLIGGER